jgi:hypothetical protein
MQGCPDFPDEYWDGVSENGMHIETILCIGGRCSAPLVVRRVPRTCMGNRCPPYPACFAREVCIMSVAIRLELVDSKAWHAMALFEHWVDRQ